LKSQRKEKGSRSLLNHDTGCRSNRFDFTSLSFGSGDKE
jgi:hypothetical protein